MPDTVPGTQQVLNTAAECQTKATEPLSVRAGGRGLRVSMWLLPSCSGSHSVAASEIHALLVINNPSSPRRLTGGNSLLPALGVCRLRLSAEGPGLGVGSGCLLAFVSCSVSTSVPIFFSGAEIQIAKGPPCRSQAASLAGNSGGCGQGRRAGCSAQFGTALAGWGGRFGALGQLSDLTALGTAGVVR